METKLNSQLREVITVAHCKPSLSVLLPVAQKINYREETAHTMKIASDKAEALLLQDYPPEQCRELILKYQKLTSNHIIPPGARSVAVYVSPEFEKILFLDFALQERIVIDGSFQVRDLVLRSRYLFPFIVLILAAKGNQFYLGNSPDISLKALRRGDVKNAASFANDAPERVANFSDLHERKQQVIERFLRYTDKKLGDVVHEYNFPVLVVGTARLLGHFKAITKYSRNITGYVHGNFQRLSLADLACHLEPHLSFRTDHEQKILRLLEEEKNRGKVASGISNAWHALAEGRGRMLIVEENFYCSSGEKASLFAPAVPKEGIAKNLPADAVDDLIEMALRKNCEVEFVSDGALRDQGNVALIEYY